MIQAIGHSRQSRGKIALATIEIVRDHTLGEERAHEAVQSIAERMESEIGIDYRWEGSTLKFKRTGARGRIRVSDCKIKLEVNLSLMLQPMKPVIETNIEEYLDEFLG